MNTKSQVTSVTQSELKRVIHYNPITGVFSRILPDKSLEPCTPKGKGYLTISIKGTRYPAHRLAFLYMEGKLPEMVAHLNKCKQDNRWENLEAYSKKEASRNTGRIKTSKGTGIFYHRPFARWAVAYTDSDGVFHSSWELTEEDAKAKRLLFLQLYSNV